MEVKRSCSRYKLFIPDLINACEDVQSLMTQLNIDHYSEVVYGTIGNPAFCLALYLTGVHFRGELQHVGDVSERKIKV